MSGGRAPAGRASAGRGVKVLARRLRTPERYRFAGTLAPLALSHRDPCARLSATELWWACRTPAGAGTLHLSHCGDGVAATGYGPGGEWLVEQADAIAGLRDDVTEFASLVAGEPVLRAAWRQYAGLRLTRSGRLFVHLLPTVLTQKVTGKEATRSYLRIVRQFGEPAPGPCDGLLLPPDPAAVAATPYWAFHPYGVEQRRADTLRRVAAAATALEAASDPAAATARLLAIPGIGVWTTAEVVRLAFGDPDAVSIGDYHIPHHVVHALTGAPRAGSRVSAPGQPAEADLRMLELLEPYRPQRARVCQVLLAAAPGAPRFGPRMPIRSFARY